jgi:hypothetical protein
MTGHGDVLYLTTLLVIPGMIGLLLLMQWLETHIARVMVADDIARLLRSEASVDDLEQSIANASQQILAGIHRGSGSTAATRPERTAHA